MNHDQAFFEISRALLTLASESYPDDFKARFAGLVANVVGNLPEDYWRQFIIVAPCGRPGCTCHEAVQKHGADLFKLLRADHAKHCEVFTGAA